MSKKEKLVDVEFDVPGDVYMKLQTVAKKARTDLNTVVNVILALSLFEGRAKKPKTRKRSRR